MFIHADINTTLVECEEECSKLEFAYRSACRTVADAAVALTLAMERHSAVNGEHERLDKVKTKLLDFLFVQSNMCPPVHER